MSLRRLYAPVLIAAFLSSGAWSANDNDPSVKQGWTVNPIPSMSYDTDFGLMAGGILDLTCYGQDYPKYRHRLCLEALTYSKHASYFMISYDSRYLIPGIRTSFRANLDNNPLYWFYGFNGAVSDYDPGKNCNRKDGIAYYSMDRVYLNTRLEFSGPLSAHINWTSRITYWHYWIKELNWEGYDHTNTLFRYYRQLGLIEDAESDGGDVIEFLAGLRYDTRNHEHTPTRGIYADFNVALAPDLFSTGYDYLKLAARFRQYISLGTERLVFAYSMAYQGTVAGNQPFYTSSYITHFKPAYGLGGATTLRGVLYNRIVGDDYLWGNFEFRARLIDATILKRRVFGVVSPFFDAGAIVRPFRFDRQAQALYYDYTAQCVTDNVTPAPYDRYRSSLLDKARELHMAWGIGGQLVIDYNFIPTITFGIPFDKRDGDFGLYMVLDYIF